MKKTISMYSQKEGCFSVDYSTLDNLVWISRNENTIAMIERATVRDLAVALQRLVEELEDNYEIEKGQDA